MKKLTALLTITTMLLCTACGNSDTGTSDSSVSSTSENSSVSRTENNSSDDDKSSAADIKESEPEDEGHYFDLLGINYFVPPYFEGTGIHGHSIWSKKLESGSVEYFSLIDKESYGSKNGIDSYNLEDVPEILRESILSDMNEFFDVGATASEITVEKDEQIEILGTQFIKRTGIVHAVRSGKATGDLPYAAYYGLIDMEYYEKVPICWITFSDDESTKSELESIADTLAEKIERVEE